MLAELFRYRELLLTMTQRELTVRYKQTAFGVAWAILQPLSLMLILTAFFSFFAGMPSNGLPYPLFSYAGLLPWTFFTTALSFATPSLISHAHIITKVYFPREIIPLCCVLAALVDFGIAAIVFLPLLAVYHVAPGWAALYVLPLLFVQIAFVTGLCLWFSAITVIYRDVRFTLPLVLQLWFFATPIVYPLEIIPDRFRTAYLLLNPMAVLVDGYRRALLLDQPPELATVLSAATISLGVLVIAYRTFKRLERTFADLV